MKHIERILNTLGAVAALSLIAAVVLAVLSIPHPGDVGRFAWYALAVGLGALLWAAVIAVGYMLGKPGGGQ